jgi:hypothetical protein
LIFGKINRKFDELALGKENVLVINKIQDQEFLCSSADNIFNCIKFLRSKDFKRKILWIGNSQLNGVNQGTFNSKIAPYLVSEYFYKKNIGVIVFAAPNISFQEYYQVISYLLSNIDFEYVILPLFFDDTRENNIRNNLIELCVPYEMIHKNSGNYLKLVDKKVTLNDYLINKQIKKNLEFVPSNKYKDYDEFIQKNNNIYRSVNINNSIIDDLIKKCSMTKGTTGIIRKKIITNDCFIIYESCGKYYAQYEIRKSIDIVRNISCKLSEDGIIIGDLNYEITISDDNRIFDKSNDIVLLTMS